MGVLKANGPLSCGRGTTHVVPTPHSRTYPGFELSRDAHIAASDGMAHVSSGDSPIQFMVGSGNSSIKFSEPGTYKYNVHISGVKGHAHSGVVIVK